MQVEVEARDIRAPRPFEVRLEGRASGPNGGWTYTDTVRVSVVDAANVPSAIDVMVEQLITLRTDDPFSVISLLEGLAFGLPDDDEIRKTILMTSERWDELLTAFTTSDDE